MRKSTVRELLEEKVRIALMPGLTSSQRATLVRAMLAKRNPDLKASTITVHCSEVNTIHRRRRYVPHARTMADTLRALDDLLDTEPAERTRYEHVFMQALRHPWPPERRP